MGASGLRGWGWRDVQSAFVRLEDDHDFADRAYHGDSGPLPIERTPVADWGPVAKAFGEAAAAGVPWCDDINAPGARGVYPGPRNTRNGLRVTTNDAYLEPARERSDLTILGNAGVDRIVFDRRRAVGVRVEVAGAAQTIESGTIVLSAGAIHSPAILMRSGIGAATQLQGLGIPVVSDLPSVGENLGDHPLIEISLDLKSTARSSPADVLAYNCGLRTQSDVGATDDLSMFAANYSESVEQGAVAVALMQPVSRGRLWLRSADAASEPWIEFGMLAEGRDCAALRDGVRRALALTHRGAMSSVYTNAWAPGLTESVLGDDHALTGWLRAKCLPFFHAVGTCRMGAQDDPRTVVAPDCRVRDVENVFVCDASIITTPLRAPTHLTAVMLAEHLAERLRR